MNIKHLGTLCFAILLTCNAQLDPWWLDTHHNRTVYFMSRNGISNQIMAYFSAAVWANVSRANLKLVRSNATNKGSASIRNNFDRLFSSPRFNWVEGFPVEDCVVHHVRNNRTLAESLFLQGWKSNILCLLSGYQFQPYNESISMFYQILQPSEELQQIVSTLKHKHLWDVYQWICVHVRRTDLGIPFMGRRERITNVLPLSAYADRLRKIIDPEYKMPRIFLATDDTEAEVYLRSEFGKYTVVTYNRDYIGRVSYDALKHAVVDLVMLSQCPIIVGTYYSTFSMTAHRMSNGSYFYIVKPILP